MLQKLSKNLLKNYSKKKKRIGPYKNVTPEPYLKTNVDTKDYYAISQQELLKQAKPFKEYLNYSRFRDDETPIPMSPSLRPYKINNMEVGKKYKWCSCGMSATQPFCDDSHINTKFYPVTFVLHEQIETSYFCGCKHSNKKPFCDGETCLAIKNNQKPADNQFRFTQQNLEMFKEKDSLKNFLKQNPYVLAPMVDHSDLPFRMLTRKYNTGLCFTPMVNSKLVVNDKQYRQRMFKTCEGDRPLVLQVCGNDPKLIVEAANFYKDHIDIVDLNLGCPQNIAKKGNYGSFLLEKEEKVLEIVEYAVNNLKVPFSCKIRIFDDEERTINFVKKLESLGIIMLTVHGRTRQQNKHAVGNCNWDIIKRIKNTLNIPVISNGGISNFEEIQKCLEYTGVDGVMSAEAILEYPALFDYNNGELYDMDDLTQEYMDCVQKYPDNLNYVKSHLFKMLYTGFKYFTDLRDEMAKSRTFEERQKIVEEMKSRRSNWTKKQKLGWYSRYRKTEKEFQKAEDNTQVEKNYKEVDKKDTLTNEDHLEVIKKNGQIINIQLQNQQEIKEQRKKRKEIKKQKKIEKKKNKLKLKQQQPTISKLENNTKIVHFFQKSKVN